VTVRAVVAIGVGQCVNWGVLYYAFAVLLLPVEAALGVERWAVAGAFSVALLLSAVAAPTVGRWSDRGSARHLILGGGLAAATLLLFWAAFPTIWVLYAVWAGLGLCMAAALYEPAFAIVGRTHDDPTSRLRALGIVTLFGGVASTVFLPLTGVLVGTSGWRAAVVVLAVLLALTTWVVDRTAFHHAPPAVAGPVRAAARDVVAGNRRSPSGFSFLVLAFGFASLSSAAVIANLVPSLDERGVSPAAAAAIGGMFGLMQLPGRALMTHGALMAAPGHLLAASLGLQALGLIGWTAGSSMFSAVAGVAIFGVGSGMTTLVRPYFVQTIVADGQAGYWNGRLAQAQQLARAAGPVLLASIVTAVSYRAAYIALGVVFVALALSSMASAGSRTIRTHPVAAARTRQSLRADPDPHGSMPRERL
jgi:MFS family permease